MQSIMPDFSRGWVKLIVRDQEKNKRLNVTVGGIKLHTFTSIDCERMLVME